ncbi:hypothetical protein TMM008_00160 [Pseudomonas sp. 008]|nr:hypothetical protein TMM008_00160 [Pseudomonas sp. 008]
MTDPLVFTHFDFAHPVQAFAGSNDEPGPVAHVPLRVIFRSIASTQYLVHGGAVCDQSVSARDE